MRRNIAGQKWLAFAFNRTTGAPATGVAGSITGRLRKDYGSPANLATVNPTEIELGYYAFSLTQVETDADVLELLVACSASGVSAVAVDPVRFTDRLSGDEVKQWRYRLGIDGETDEPTTNTTNLAVTLRPSVVISSALPVVDEGLAFEITQRDDFEDDADVGPIGPIRIQTDLDLLRETNPPRLRFGATQKLGSKFSSTTHMIGSAYAEAVAGEADQFDLFIEITATELDKPPGLYGWDIEAVYDTDGDVRTIVGGLMTLKRSMGDNEDRDPLNP